VLCDQCRREFTAPAGANATNCPECGAWLSLADFEIDEPWNEPIHTRGNVVVRRKGWITEVDVDCHDLLLVGRLERGASCTGSLVIRRSGMIRGKLRCRELRVERRARVHFIHPVETTSAVINGQVIGSIRATATVALQRHSKLTGNITATALIMKRAARHHGRLRIISDDSEVPEPAD
jgi:cytoskeletal protein CcmA (bactofilin family)